MDHISMFFELAHTYAPSINALIVTISFAIRLWLLQRYAIIKPTRR